MENLVAELLKGSIRALARFITLVENGDLRALRLMGEIYSQTGKAHILGITGAPGTGKSTLTDKITAVLRERQQTVGIVAVDPSSPFTGGAVLGDRIRMLHSSGDPEVFIRSMATRGNLGGLARTTGDVVKILDAFGKDWIIVETVGVGQDEVEIAKTADTTVVVLAPGFGDTIQSMKAGVMEIADLFVVNKADRFGAEELINEINARLEQDSHFKESSWLIPVLKTVATENQGAEQLVNAIVEHRNFLRESGQLQQHRRERAREETLSLLQEEISRNVLEKVLGNGRFEALIDDIVANKKDPYSSVREIVSTIFPEGGEIDEGTEN